MFSVLWRFISVVFLLALCTKQRECEGTKTQQQNTQQYQESSKPKRAGLSDGFFLGASPRISFSSSAAAAAAGCRWMAERNSSLPVREAALNDSREHYECPVAKYTPPKKRAENRAVKSYSARWGKKRCNRPGRSISCPFFPSLASALKTAHKKCSI